MNHWPYIIAAYAITVLGAAGLSLHAWAAMRRAEREAEAIRRK
ncbi:heme exporter protein CcmD [Sphingomonas changnyeongensis]|uniref:Heme exporter protein D n=1 Tax=Sphingomonas changnyeongensis TaxID=2698679 RepID=A0A7Z2NX58_9SPHN|nr:heme exporter protein CcmD [Sphingomonas changnyeongensis]QHL90859.1 heme exporter protein CcmD [Sphingomonas changnyeongensis]